MNYTPLAIFVLDETDNLVGIFAVYPDVPSIPVQLSALFECKAIVTPYVPEWCDLLAAGSGGLGAVMHFC